MLTFETIIVFIAIAFILYSLYAEFLGPALTFFVAILFLGTFNVISPAEILHGFANEQVAVIVLLLLFGDIIRKTSIIERVFDVLFIGAKSYKGFLSRMMLIVATFSSFLNNTPLVAIMMPYVHNWCHRNHFAPSKFLIPLSYAAILGGSVTLIGTSTNLIVSYMVDEQTIIPDLPSLKMFDFVYVGIPMTIIGFLYILFFGNKLLPNRQLKDETTGEANRAYMIEARVRIGSKLIGKTVQQAELENYKGLYLVEVRKDNQSYAPSEEEIPIEPDDILVYAGDKKNIGDFIDNASNLVISEVGMFVKQKRTKVTEIIVSQNSTLRGKKLSEVNFRARYDATVLAMQRNGEQIRSGLDEVVLRAGDVLLLFAGSDFDTRTHNTQDFYFISVAKDTVKIENYKVYILLFGLVLSIILASFNVMSLFMGLSTLIMVALLFKITNAKELPRSIDYNLIIIIVMSLALGKAMLKTNAAGLIAEGIITFFLPLGKVGLLFGVYLITTILAAYITNKASVGIVFPIALTIAHNLDIPATPFVLTIAYASAANFMTPIGYQTNLMVYGPGGYKFKDFFFVGAPLTVLYMITTVIILSALYIW